MVRRWIFGDGLISEVMSQGVYCFAPIHFFPYFPESQKLLADWCITSYAPDHVSVCVMCYNCSTIGSHQFLWEGTAVALFPGSIWENDSSKPFSRCRLLERCTSGCINNKKRCCAVPWFYNIYIYIMYIYICGIFVYVHLIFQGMFF